MGARREITQATAARYRKADRKGKGQMLNEFCELTGYNRCYAGFLLRNYGKSRVVGKGDHVRKLVPVKQGRKPRGRPRKYGVEVQKALKGLWAHFDFLCGKRMERFLRTTLPLMQRHQEIVFPEAVVEQLLSISASTIDRLLAPEKARMRLKGRAHTKPAALLQHQVPIRTWSEWDEVEEPGHVQMDLVGHDGGSNRGEFAFTLTVTDYFCQWTERRAVKNRAQKWVFEAIQEIRTALPFPVKSINTDSGGEFINHNLIDYCQRTGIRFTRSRPSRKNDNCLVEQKNYDAVRKIVGYLRYDTEEERALLNQIYRLHGLLFNYLYPSQRLVEKHREGSKVFKKHDEPSSPCQRLLDAEYVSKGLKIKLRVQYYRLHPLEISKQISRLQDQLLKTAKQKRDPAGSLKVANL
jgi:IS30 family transposase